MNAAVGGSGSKSKQSSYSESNPLTAGQVNKYWNKLNSDTGGRLDTFAKTGTSPVNYTGVDNPAQYFSTDLTYKPQTADLGFDKTQADIGYHGISDAQIQALGGLGATRSLQNSQARQEAVSQIAADAGLTLAQRQRSTQLTDRDYADRADAIAKESEAAMTQAAMDRAAQDQAGRQAQATFDSGQNQLDQQGRQAQATFDADQWAKELEGRQATAAQEQALAGFLQSEAGKQFEAAMQNAGIGREDMLALAQIYFGGKGQKSTSTSQGSSSAFGFNVSGGMT